MSLPQRPPQIFPLQQTVDRSMVCGVSARIARVSYSGEPSYEVSVPARFGPALWAAPMQVGEPFGITAYGVEAALLLLTEKGYLHVGVYIDGTTVPADIGWGEGAMRKQADFIGKRSLSLPAHVRGDRRQLVGLCDFSDPPVVPGAHLRLRGTREGSDGWISSVVDSPTLGTTVALAVLAGGRTRHGESVCVFDDGRQYTAKVCAPAFYDPQSGRLNG